ncbi:MAG: DUF4303 domain-containing protein [Planctomycetaceae bacterium]
MKEDRAIKSSQPDGLQLQITNAVRQAAEQLRASKSELFGFALCTDDDVRTLYHVACTRDWVREKEVGYPEIGYVYVEWMDSANDKPFDEISKQFKDLADASNGDNALWAKARDQRFDLLVNALRKCREEGVFAADTLLCAGSTDPSTHLEMLGMNCVDAVNTPEVADRFARALGYEKYR